MDNKDLHDVYKWVAYYQDDVKFGGKLNKEGLIRFDLIPTVNYLKKISIKLDSTKELIYFKRVICSMSGEIENILYHVGYRQNNEEKVICVNSITGEINEYICT